MSTTTVLSTSYNTETTNVIAATCDQSKHDRGTAVDLNQRPLDSENHKEA